MESTTVAHTVTVEQLYGPQESCAMPYAEITRHLITGDAYVNFLGDWYRVAVVDTYVGTPLATAWVWLVAQDGTEDSAENEFDKWITVRSLANLGDTAAPIVDAIRAALA